MKIGEMDMEGKYVVFKKDEFERWRRDMEYEDYPDTIDECMVIRYQDVFASTAFYNYAETIRTALDLMRILGVDHPSLAVLELTANRFAEAAADAQQYEGRKVPD